MVLRTQNVCGKARGWRRRGSLPGLAVWPSPLFGEYSVSFGVANRARPNFGAVYRVAIHYEGVRFRRWLWIQREDTPSRRIWEGTDAFWNYCVNGGHKTYSSGGWLYCVKPGRHVEYAYFYRKRPRF